MKVLFLEPFYGGSHRDFAKGLVAYSCHDIDLYTLPGSNWRWRIRGAALHFARTVKNINSYDCILATDLMSITDFKTFAGPSCPPILLYIHENQITYPLAQGEKLSFEFGINDIKNALSADRVFFNSKIHRNEFINALPEFLNRTPDFKQLWIIDKIESKSDYIYPGCHFPKTPVKSEHSIGGEPPLIIWNHRWNYDKNALSFFNVLENILEQGIEFRLALLGENHGRIPEIFETAKERYYQRIVHYGYEPDHNKYIGWLRKGDIVVSTSKQENFGISVVEAIRHGCFPLLPDRLSYPEILPEKFHGDFLYRSQKDLQDKLSGLLQSVKDKDRMREEVSNAMSVYSWEEMINLYDAELSNLTL